MPHVIDLYAGAGGLSLGAARANFTVAAAVEKDRFALDTHKKNFPFVRHSSADVSLLKGDDLFELAGLRKGQLDGLIGGPPCQGFSTIGRRDEKDSRNNLFVHFFRLVRETSPKFYVAENVPGILDPGHDALRGSAFELVEQDYIVLPPLMVTASDFGAPTTRKRVFFVGYKRKHFVGMSTEALTASAGQLVTVKEALEGLPIRIDSRWQTEESGWREVGQMTKGGFSDSITGNVPSGVGDPGLIDRYFTKRQVSGCLGTRHLPEVRARFASIKPGEVDRISRAPRLDPGGLCPTLRAGTGADRGSYQAVRPIHPVANRVITPREAARLQGFPDWFVFHRTKWHSFRQIGNSVSPIVAEALLSAIRAHLKE